MVTTPAQTHHPGAEVVLMAPASSLWPTHVGAGTLHPIGRRSVDGSLDIAAVKVDDFSRWQIVARIDYAELAPQVRACVGDVINIEARVNFEGSGVDVIKDIAGVVR